MSGAQDNTDRIRSTADGTGVIGEYADTGRRSRAWLEEALSTLLGVEERLTAKIDDVKEGVSRVRAEVANTPLRRTPTRSSDFHQTRFASSHDDPDWNIPNECECLSEADRDRSTLGGNDVVHNDGHADQIPVNINDPGLRRTAIPRRKRRPRGASVSAHERSESTACIDMSSFVSTGSLRKRKSATPDKIEYGTPAVFQSDSFEKCENLFSQDEWATLSYSYKFSKKKNDHGLPTFKTHYWYLYCSHGGRANLESRKKGKSNNMLIYDIPLSR